MWMSRLGFFFFKKEKILMSVMNYSHLHLHIPINNRFCSVHSIAFTKSFYIQFYRLYDSLHIVQ